MPQQQDSSLWFQMKDWGTDFHFTVVWSCFPLKIEDGVSVLLLLPAWLHWCKKRWSSHEASSHLDRDTEELLPFKTYSWASGMSLHCNQICSLPDDVGEWYLRMTAWNLEWLTWKTWFFHFIILKKWLFNLILYFISSEFLFPLVMFRGWHSTALAKTQQ